MSNFDYEAAAELFPSRNARVNRKQPVSYRRFDHAADAIKFAIEELPKELLNGAFLEVGDERFDATAIQALYDSSDYPRARSGFPG